MVDAPLRYAVRERPGVGGGRGLFATVDLNPGEVILAEAAVLGIPDDKREDEVAHVAIARALLKHPNHTQLMERFAHLHPQSISDVTQHMRTQVAEAYGARMDVLVEATGTARDLALLVLLKMQFNAFYGGIYDTFSMLNHSDIPNATKSNGGLAVSGQGVGTDAGLDYLQATRPIAAGEEIVISYLLPVWQSLGTRHREFEQQHLCTYAPPTSLDPRLEEWREIGADTPQYSPSSMVMDVEREVEDLEDRCKSGELAPKAAVAVCMRLKATCNSFLGPRNVVLVRLDQLLVTSAEACLQRGEASVGMAIILLKGAVSMRMTQELLLGLDHVDVGWACESAQQALGYIMGHDLAKLARAFPEWADQGKASRAHHQLEARATAILSLYTARA